MMAKRPKPKPVKIVEEGKKSVTVDIVYMKSSINPNDLEPMHLWFYMTCVVSIIKARKWSGLTLTKLSNGKVFLKSELNCVEIDLVPDVCDAVEIEFSKKKKLTDEEAKKLFEEGLARFYGSENFAEEGEYLGKF